jgi:hypothetical protein
VNGSQVEARPPLWRLNTSSSVVVAVEAQMVAVVAVVAVS